MAQTVPLYVGIEAPPDFDLHGRLRGPGALLDLTYHTQWLDSQAYALCFTGSLLRRSAQKMLTLHLTITTKLL